MYVGEFFALENAGRADQFSSYSSWYEDLWTCSVSWSGTNPLVACNETTGYRPYANVDLNGGRMRNLSETGYTAVYPAPPQETLDVDDWDNEALGYIDFRIDLYTIFSAPPFWEADFVIEAEDRIAQQTGLPQPTRVIFPFYNTAEAGLEALFR
jgi:hypothetical protein